MNKTRDILLDQIYNLSPQNFDQICMGVYQYQIKYNPLYSKFVQLLGKEHSVSKPEEIPFLPISLFKNHQIQSDNWKEEAIFRSSGTTSSSNSQHWIRSLDWYNRISEKTFEKFYGPVSDYAILALLPSYLERNDSSLVYMIHHFIQKSN